MPYPISDIASNFALYNKVYERSTVLHDKTANTIRVADGITAYNSLSIVRGRVEVTPVNANLVYAGPASGATPANPVFRAVVPLDLGASTGASKVLTRDGSGGMDWQTPVTPTTTIVVGTTPVTSGTVGRVFYEGAGNVVQQHSGFNYDATNGLVIGGATPSGTRLTVVNEANTNASKTFVVRNAADSATMMELSGDGVLRVQSTAGYGGTISPYTSLDAFWLTGGTPAANADPTRAGIFMTSTNIGMYAGTGTRLRYVLKFDTELAGPSGTDWHLISGGSALSGSLYLASAAGTANAKFHFTANSHFNVGAIGNSTNGSNLIKVLNGTAPTANSTNCMQIYAQNITDASFHVRDSNDRVFYAGEKVGMRSNHDLKLAANNTVYVTVSTAGLVTLADASNIAVGSTTGTKIGTATTQKLSFWNKTPIVQPTTAITAATFAANTSGIVDDTATYGGYTIGQLAAIIINSGLAA